MNMYLLTANSPAKIPATIACNIKLPVPGSRYACESVGQHEQIAATAVENCLTVLRLMIFFEASILTDHVSCLNLPCKGVN